MRPVLTRMLPALAAALGLSGAASAQSGYSVEILHEGLDRPWALEFLPGGEDIVITGRGGALWLHEGESGGLRSLSGTPSVATDGQGGLLDIAAAPDFAESRHVWLTWSGAGEGGATTHLGRARLGDEGLEGLETVFTVSPFMNSPAHFGSRIVFHEGDMYVGLGDRSQKDFGPEHISQRLDSENGTVIRLTADGGIPGDNPFVDTEGAQDAIWSYGHRNIQAMAVQPGTGALWVAEHGENGGDEINVVERGSNYGWPLAAHGVTYSGGEVFAPPHREGDGFIAPVWHAPAGREAPYPPSGMAFYEGDAFPDWEGHMLLGNLGQEYLGLFAVSGETGGEQVELVDRLLADQGWRIRDVAVGPDGYVYVISDGENGRLVRLVPGS